jgi:hypothetical protein
MAPEKAACRAVSPGRDGRAEIGRVYRLPARSFIQGEGVLTLPPPFAHFPATHTGP